jgi:hypothetical protein
VRGVLVDHRAEGASSALVRGGVDQHDRATLATLNRARGDPVRLDPDPFVIRRSARRATVALTVDADKLVVTAPAETTINRLNAVVRHKGLWVVQRIGHARERSVREFVSGETVRYLGRQYRLNVVEGAGTPRIRGRWYHVPHTAGAGGSGHDALR